MSNPLFALLGGMQQMSGVQNSIASLQSALQQLRSNPTEVLKQAGYSVPDNIGNNPQAILNHLMSSGQISQDKLMQAQQAAAKYRR